MEIRLLDVAQQEMDESFEFYEEQMAGLGHDFLAEPGAPCTTWNVEQRLVEGDCLPELHYVAKVGTNNNNENIS